MTKLAHYKPQNLIVPSVIKERMYVQGLTNLNNSYNKNYSVM